MYYRKTPRKRFTPDKCHWTKTSAGHWKAKRTFVDQASAEDFVNTSNESNLSAYKCTICNKWHVGHINPKDV